MERALALNDADQGHKVQGVLPGMIPETGVTLEHHQLWPK